MKKDWLDNEYDAEGNNTNFESCLYHCIVEAIAGGATDEVMRWAMLPKPTVEQWAQCLEVISNEGGDVKDHRRCIDRWGNLQCNLARELQM